MARRSGRQKSEAPGVAFPDPKVSGGDAVDPVPPNQPTAYLPHVGGEDRPARRRAELERDAPRSDTAPSGGP
jgi:hypothetical protein